ncbi:14272_t:CDS:2 [Racocetra fulgida]|uniref:14272_t:CDS:1 n=1 Tax=Racocetra fulgida TaxID=60492 RepID=A0A9N8ZLB6_9GLOM|nr:14272_t:CDS:2 [Racocetra fulgida]
MSLFVLQMTTGIRPFYGQVEIYLRFNGVYLTAKDLLDINFSIIEKTLKIKDF